MPVKLTTIDLERLTQAQTAWLIGRSPRWLRDNAHQFKRNLDGRYDGREVFGAMAELLGRVVIPWDEFQTMVAFCADPSNCEDCIAGRMGDCEFHGPGGQWEPS